MIGLAVIPYSLSIRYLLNSLPMNSDHCKYVISIGIRYLDSHIVSTKLAIDITILLLYCVILNNPVT